LNSYSLEKIEIAQQDELCQNVYKTRGQKEVNQNALAGVKKAIDAAADTIASSILSRAASAIRKEGRKSSGKSRIEIMSPKERRQTVVKAAKVCRNKKQPRP
jgi:hypothetical protein